jgi:hypothetical protein
MWKLALAMPRIASSATCAYADVEAWLDFIDAAGCSDMETLLDFIGVVG